MGSYWCSMRAFLSCSLWADIVAIGLCTIEQNKMMMMIVQIVCTVLQMHTIKLHLMYRIYESQINALINALRK